MSLRAVEASDPETEVLAAQLAAIIVCLRDQGKFNVRMFVMAAQEGMGGTLVLTNASEGKTKRSVPEAVFVAEGSQVEARLSL